MYCFSRQDIYVVKHLQNLGDKNLQNMFKMPKKLRINLLKYPFPQNVNVLRYLCKYLHVHILNYYQSLHKFS